MGNIHILYFHIKIITNLIIIMSTMKIFMINIQHLRYRTNLYVTVKNIMEVMADIFLKMTHL